MEVKNGGYSTATDVEITIEDDYYSMKDTKLGSSSTVVRMFVLKAKDRSSDVSSEPSPLPPSSFKTASVVNFMSYKPQKIHRIA